VERCDVLGVNCFAGRVEAAARAVVEQAASGDGGYACLCNVHVLMSAQHDAELRGALDGAWSVFADGWPVAWLERRFGIPFASRVAGADLMAMTFVLGQRVGLRHYLLGSTDAVIERLVERLTESYPLAQIVGAEAAPFAAINDAAWLRPVDAIRRAEPDVVWLGLGAPKQELWMGRYAPSVAPAVVLGVGAAFDFHAGTKHRAPAWMQRSSLEWVHRLASEPGRLAGRYVRTNSEFVLRAGLELSRRRWAS
jgi:N-acetylglucosaminyldiphosphoundecaprenol N-acetyl-beta-D-mannosaminyltransferase